MKLNGIDMTKLTDPSTWASDLVDATEWAAECSQPFDDAPEFGNDSPEVDVSAGLADDKAHVRTPIRRLFRDYRSQPDAYKHLAYLPQPGEDLEMIISGKYAMWDLVPSLIERTGQNITDLTIATLSFSKANAAELLGLVDEGRVTRVGLLVSYFFKAQNRHLYDSLVPHLRERGHKVLAMRTHAKVILAKMVDGTCFSIRGSPNMRSCKNVEQLTMTNCPELYAYHHGWIHGELLSGKVEEGKA